VVAYKHKESGAIKHATEDTVRHHAMDRDPNWVKATKAEVEADNKARAEALAKEQEQTPSVAGTDQAK